MKKDRERFYVMFLIFLIYFIAYIFQISILKIFLGFVILFIPGYALSYVLFKELEELERFTLGMAISIAIVPLVTFYLDKLGAPINFISTIALLLAIVLFSFFYRYHKAF